MRGIVAPEICRVLAASGGVLPLSTRWQPSRDLPGLEAFGITPTPLAAVAPEWLGRFRKGGRFAPRAA